MLQCLDILTQGRGKLSASECPTLTTDSTLHLNCNKSDQCWDAKLEQKLKDFSTDLSPIKGENPLPDQSDRDVSHMSSRS